MTGLVPLEFTEVYQRRQARNLTEELIKRLKTLCRSETIRYCIYLNRFVSALENPLLSLGQQRDLLRLFFDRADMEEINNRFATATPIPRTFFHRAQLLGMIRYAALYCPETDCHRTPVQNKSSKRNFTEAALLVSEIATKEINAELESVGEDTSRKREMLLRLARLNARPTEQSLERAFGRGKLMFFHYLPNEFTDFRREFEAHTRLTLEEYFSCLFLMLASYYKAPLSQGPQPRHWIEIGTLREQIPQIADAFVRYIELEAQTIDELQTALGEDGQENNSYSLKGIREKPILRLTEDTVMVVDPILHTQRAMLSPLFMLSRELAEKGIGLQGHFGDAFERYVQAILQKMYEGTGKGLYLSDELMVDEKEICDACFIEGNALLLFEMKAVWIRDDKIADPDPDGYLSELRKKYGKEGNAAFQLARAANRLIDGTWGLKDHDMKKTKRIYPILIAYDALLATPGHFWFFASEFRAIFEPDMMFGNSKVMMVKSGWEIAPVTIVTIDVLEDLEASVRNFRLSDLLRDYFAYCDANFRDTEDDFPLYQFILQSPKYAPQMDRRGTVLMKALETFEEAMRMYGLSV